MAIYEYRALDRAGKSVKGVVDAFDTEAVKKKLKVKGIYLESVRELHTSKRSSFLSLSFTRKRTVTARITRQLSFLLGANMPVISALDGAIDSIEDTTAKSMMIDIKEKVKEGKNVSSAFADYPNYFNQMYISTLHAGEVSGKLETVFERLASMYENHHPFSRIIHRAYIFEAFQRVRPDTASAHTHPHRYIELYHDLVVGHSHSYRSLLFHRKENVSNREVEERDGRFRSETPRSKAHHSR
jgi:general secretion pathway protein F